jgi:Prion-inhibition and propagation
MHSLAAQPPPLDNTARQAAEKIRPKEPMGPLINSLTKCSTRVLRFCFSQRPHLRNCLKSSLFIAKAKWAMRDRQGFSGLIGDLRDLVESLYQVVPVPPQLNQSLVKQDFDKLLDDLGMLRLVDEACSDRKDEWSEGARARRENTEIATEDGISIMEYARRENTGTGTENAARIMKWTQNIQTAEDLTEISTSQTDALERPGGADETPSERAKQSIVRNRESGSEGVPEDQDWPILSSRRGSARPLQNLSKYRRAPDAVR